MNVRRHSLDRRAFLRGLGASLGLPFLDAMVPAVAAPAPVRPQRLVFLYSPNGRHMERWTPLGIGRAFTFSPTLEPLAPLRDQITIVSGLDHEQAKAMGDGPGDHARANACFLTGVHPRKTAGNDVHAGISADQIAAAKIGHLTRLPSLELGCDNVRAAGRCDSGYACAYQFNLSWKSATTPMPPETSPRAVFERLFGGGSSRADAAARESRLRWKKSVLDFALEDASTLSRSLGSADRAKLDEYLTSVREVERRIERDEASGAQSAQAAAQPPPEGIPKHFGDHLRLMFDLLALALQSDSTRVATFLMASEASLRPFDELGIPEAHHFLSHHQGNPGKLEKIAQIDRWYATQVAYFLTTLQKMADAGGGSVLDNSMVVYGCGIADGNDHGHENLPLLVAGRGGGQLSPGQHCVFEGATPVTNLHRALLAHMGVPVERLGDSTGLLEGI
jgi:hypothetical protein